MSKIKDALERAKRVRGVSSPFVLIEDEPGMKPKTTPQSASTQKIINYNQETVNKHHIITLGNDLHGISERFKLFKTQFLTKMQISGDRTILISSCIDGEGKTFTAINLAIMLAREVDQRVLLVDVNLHHPSILSALGIPGQEGLTDYLLNNTPLNDLLIGPGIEKLSLLPAGRTVENSSELLGSQKMQNLIAEMKGRYHDRYILFDGPSILLSVDTLVLSKYIEKTLLVIESGKVSPLQLSEAMKLIGEDKILGTVLNKRNPV
jgi:protein-tyrosine kinase